MMYYLSQLVLRISSDKNTKSGKNYITRFTLLLNSVISGCAQSQPSSHVRLLCSFSCAIFARDSEHKHNAERGLGRDGAHRAESLPSNKKKYMFTFVYIYYILYYYIYLLLCILRWNVSEIAALNTLFCKLYFTKLTFLYDFCKNIWSYRKIFVSLHQI